MTFVQITYGSTINRQLRNIVSWATSELMVLWYINVFRTSYWPPGDESESSVIKQMGNIDAALPQSPYGSGQDGYNRTDKDKLSTRREIEAALLQQSTDNRSGSGCLPEVLLRKNKVFFT